MQRFPIKILAWIGVAAAVLAAVAALVAWRRSRQRFDMVATLASLADREGVWDNQWDQPNEKIASLTSALSSEADPAKRFELKREIARHYLYANAPEGALAVLEELQNEVKTWPASFVEAAKADLAFAYFRLGEIQNCATNHNADSCLFPIQGKGVHRQRLGATEAAKLYTELLSDPGTDTENSLSYRWLLSLSYMTLGQYPDKVPRRWLIPPDAFKSDYDIGRFQDVAAERGVSEFGVAGGVILEDFDNDGHLDLMISHMGVRDQLEYFHNNCDGTFTDVTAEAGLLSYYPTQAATWADVNNDGFLDLFVGNEIDRERVQWPAGAKNFELYLNNRDGTFTEVGEASGIRLEGMIKAAVWGDIDNDGWQDLYVSILGRPNHLFRNLGAQSGGVPKFADVTARAGVAEPLVSFTCWFWDYDNDGWLDLFVSGYSATLPNMVREYIGQKEQAKGERPRLYRNNKDGTFTDVSREARLDRLLLTMGANFGDLDNDGWLDFYLGTGAPPLITLVPNRMFRNDHGRSFQDGTTSGGFGNLQKGHAVAFGDIDGSGNQDVVEVMGGAYSADKYWTSIYKNPGHGNHWVKLRPVGVKSNRFAVGARIRLVVAGENGASREIFSAVSSGGSFGAQASGR